MNLAALLPRTINLTLACALLLVIESVDAEETLAVCLLQDNVPYSQRIGERGFDHDLAKHLASKIGRTFRPEWIPNQTRILEIDDSDFPLFRLKKGKCDAIFSMAGPPEKTLKGHDALSLGEPYYSAAFELIECPPTGKFRALSDLRDVRVAIQSQTVAHFELLRIGGVSATTFSLEEALSKSADVGLGLLWGPTSGNRLGGQTEKRVRVSEVSGTESCRLSTDFEVPSNLVWNFHVATRKADSKLRDELDRALTRAADDGELRELLRTYGLPDREVFQ